MSMPSLLVRLPGCTGNQPRYRLRFWDSNFCRHNFLSSWGARPKMRSSSARSEEPMGTLAGKPPMLRKPMLPAAARIWASVASRAAQFGPKSALASMSGTLSFAETSLGFTLIELALHQHHVDPALKLKANAPERHHVLKAERCVQSDRAEIGRIA